MPHNAHAHNSCGSQADQLGQQNCGGQANSQGEQAAAEILRQQQEEELRSAHAHHQVDAEFMPAPFQLELSGIVNQKEEDEQRHTEEQGYHLKEPVHGLALHFAQECHYILAGQGEYNVKGDNGNQ